MCSSINHLLTAKDTGAPKAFMGDAFHFVDGYDYYSEYYYDGCGSLTRDMNKGVYKIVYDFNGMPTHVWFNNGNITEHVYTADGVKLKTIHRTAVDGITAGGSGTPRLAEENTLSKDSILYVGAWEIEDPMTSKYHFSKGYMDVREGMVQAYNYFAKDHLGNVRHVAKVPFEGDHEIVQVNNYYPFGGLHNDQEDRADIQNRLYNGKEYDRMHGLNLYDFSARQYDPAVGQFTSMDPLCEKYYHISPYTYCAGNPINLMDAHGDTITICSKNETFSYTQGKNYDGKSKFIKNVCDDLNTLNERGGRELLTELCQSRNVFSFQKGNKETGFSAQSPSRAGRALICDSKLIDFQLVGCGGIIHVNYNQEIFYPTENRNDDSVDWYIVLGHECKHASNANKGLLNSQPYNPWHVDSNLRDVTKDEQSAMAYENDLRHRNGFPLRTAYSMYGGQLFFPIIPNVKSLPYIP